MKRFTSIFFLGILFFNFWGYRFMINCLQDQHQASLTSRLDAKQYNDADLVSIKTVLNLPYYNSSSSFERTYGSIEVNGTTYEYVKSRVYNDTLELLCLPNKTKSELQTVKNQFLKFSIDGQGTQHDKKTQNIIKPGLPDFIQTFSQINEPVNEIAGMKHEIRDISSMLSGFHIRQERPPQATQFFM